MLASVLPLAPIRLRVRGFCKAIKIRLLGSSRERPLVWAAVKACKQCRVALVHLWLQCS